MEETAVPLLCDFLCAVTVGVPCHYEFMYV